MRRLSSLFILLSFLAVPFLQATSQEGSIYIQGHQLSVSGTLAAGNGLTGQFVKAGESMSARAAAYQSRVTGLGEGMVYKLNGVKFDGYANGILMDAKGAGYATFVKDGKFASWFRGADGFVDQATRQLGAAGGNPIQWHFAEEAAANATRNLLQSRGITGIEVLFTP